MNISYTITGLHVLCVPKDYKIVFSPSNRSDNTSSRTNQTDKTRCSKWQASHAPCMTLVVKYSFTKWMYGKSTKK